MDDEVYKFPEKSIDYMRYIWTVPLQSSKFWDISYFRGQIDF